MNKKERMEYISDFLRRNKRIYITSICNELGVSDDTLRRDLIEMEKEGLLSRVHGGAVQRSDTSVQILERYESDKLGKERMAEKMVALLNDGDTILIDGGTSNLEVAKALPRDMELTIFTNSFPIANELFSHIRHHAIFLGGEIDCEGQVTLGISTYRELQAIQTDWAIIGVSDLHPTEGIFCIKREEALIKSAILEHGRKRVVMASSQKLDRARTYKIANIADLTYIVTDDEGVKHIKDCWQEVDCKIVI